MQIAKQNPEGFHIQAVPTTLSFKKPDRPFFLIPIHIPEGGRPKIAGESFDSGCAIRITQAVLIAGPVDFLVVL